MRQFCAEEVDSAGERALDRIRAGCEGEGDFAARTGGALQAVLGLVAAEPLIVHQLFGPCYRPDVLERQESWREAFAAELRAATREEALSPPCLPPLTETFVVMAVGTEVLRKIGQGQAKQLQGLVPELLAFVLAYYPSAEQDKAVPRG